MNAVKNVGVGVGVGVDDVVWPPTTAITLTKEEIKCFCFERSQVLGTEAPNHCGS